MRYLIVLVVIATFVLGELALADGSTAAAIQTQNSAQEKAASLRLQLAEVEAKQSELQTRLQKLEEDIKPENIEKNLAGVGSTRPEDLREQRRRELEIERNGVRAQLNLLATSQTRLQTAIAHADAEAYRQSAAPATAAAAAPTTVDTSRRAATSQRAERPRRVRKRKARRAKRVNHSAPLQPHAPRSAQNP